MLFLMMNDLMMKRFINEVEMMFLYLYLQIIYLGGARYSVIKGQIIRLIRVENLKEWGGANLTITGAKILKNIEKNSFRGLNNLKNIEKNYFRRE